MATTLTACHFQNDSLKIGHVGDCRVYRLRSTKLEQLTKDHSDLHRGLLRAVGIEPKVQADLPALRMEPGDAYLIASDGLYGEIHEKEMAEALAGADPEDACNKLIRLSLDRGGYDNATAQVIRYDL